LGLLAVGYWVIAVGVKDLAPGTKVSMFWLVALYTIHTLGELCLSPIGLSMVNKLAPVKVASLLMGVWFLSTSAANKFAGTLSEYYPEPVVAVTAVENAGKAQNADLFPANYVKDKKKVNGVNVIALESIKFGEIKDEGARASARTALERDLVDNAKTFAGMKIANLYDFFMLFVYMSGASAVLLLVLCPMLLKMMHGVR
jgi:proton-dependent oligopeptide transporter, POT family